MDILFIVGLILFFLLTSGFAKKTGGKEPSSKKSFEEIFPEITEWSKPERKKTASPSVMNTSKENLSGTENFRKAPHSSSIPKASAQVRKASQTTEKSVSDEIRLQTPEEARRAFIYSEIFKRKYE